MSTAPIDSVVPAETREDFERAAQDLLAGEGLLAQVRLLPWTAPSGRTCVRCHVYAGNTGLFHGTPEWVWWSPVVETPGELRAALQEALRHRGLAERRLRPRPVPVLFPL